MAYPQDFINEIIHGDCLDIMKYIPNNSIDLTVTSPPYDNLRTYENQLNKFKFEPIAQELYRITKIGGVVVWVVGDAAIKGSETGTSFKQALYFKEIGFNLHDTMIYEKPGVRFPNKNRYYQCFEYMFVLSKNKPKTFNPIVDNKNKYFGQKKARSNNCDRQRNGTLKGNSAAKLHPNKIIKEYGIRYNIWRINTGGGKSSKYKDSFKHPATFPEQLAYDHIISWSNENDLILDPMCGSGTTCIMAKKANRKFIGIEIIKKYYRIALKRIMQWEKDNVK